MFTILLVAFVSIFLVWFFIFRTTSADKLTMLPYWSWTVSYEAASGITKRHMAGALIFQALRIASLADRRIPKINQFMLHKMFKESSPQELLEQWIHDSQVPIEQRKTLDQKQAREALAIMYISIVQGWEEDKGVDIDEC